MRKYWAYCRASIQETFTYRGPIFIWVVGNILSVLTIVAVWLSVSSGNLIAGYTRGELITYYVAGIFLQWLVGWMPFYYVKNDIKDGQIVLSLLKPVSLYKRIFMGELGWHLVSVWVGVLASVVFILALGQSLVFQFSTMTLLTIPAIVLSILITFSVSLCMGLLAFWFTEISALDSVFWVARSFLGGQAIPISFLPGIVKTLSTMLPFRYMFSFPLEIFFGKLKPDEIATGFLIALFWIGFWWGVYRLMFNKGRKAYTSFGS